MPCFDKKLEASRSDFYMNKAETREVDCVITSGTVTTVCVLLFVCMNVQCFLFYTFHCLMQERFRKCWRRKMCLSATSNLHPLMGCKSCNFFVIVSLPLLSNKPYHEFPGEQIVSHTTYYSWTRFSSVSGDDFLSHAGSGSGGYLHHVFTYAAKYLFGEEVKNLTYKILKLVSTFLVHYGRFMPPEKQFQFIQKSKMIENSFLVAHAWVSTWAPRSLLLFYRL